MNTRIQFPIVLNLTSCMLSLSRKQRALPSCPYTSQAFELHQPEITNLVESFSVINLVLPTSIYWENG